MFIARLEQTCSMDELSSVVTSNLESKAEFVKTLRKCYDVWNNEYTGGYSDNFKDTQVLIYNCEKRQHEGPLQKLGFKKVITYKGNNTDFEGKPVTINTWMLKVTPSLRKKMGALQQEMIGKEATSAYDDLGEDGDDED